MSNIKLSHLFSIPLMEFEYGQISEDENNIINHYLNDLRPNVYNFIEKNILILESKVTAFFTVNVVARKKEKSDPKTNPYMKKFIENVKWSPNYLAVFAGKIDFPKLKLFDRYVIKFIMWLTDGPTNTKECYDFTDWKKIRSFAEKM